MKKRKCNYSSSYVSAGFILIIILVIASSCTKSTVPTSYEPFTVVEHTELDIEDIMEQILATPDNPDEFDYHDLYYSVSQETQGIIPYLISHEVVKYTSKEDIVTC